MAEKREKHRRLLTPTAQFPFCNMRGELIASERRFLPTRRVNDIEVKELSYKDFLSILRCGNSATPGTQ
jgi:hypothetical protein